MKYDLIILGGNLYGGGLWVQENVDIAIKDGKIAEVGKGLDKTFAEVVIDASNKFISPGFVDAHMHIDKALLADDDDTADLLSAINHSSHTGMAKYSGKSREEIYQDIISRSSKILDMCIKNGTTTIKTNVLINPAWGCLALKAMTELKKTYGDRIDVFNVTPYMDGFTEEWEEAAERGEIDFIGGCPNIDVSPVSGEAEYTLDYKSKVDTAFALAEKYDLPIDLHCDESDRPNIDAFLYMIQKTMETQMQDRVTCGHVTGLSAIGMDPDYAATAIARCAKARVNVASMTSCNLYLMDWKRRGPTRVRELMEAGVNVCIASDNIRDPFRPFGSADLLREVLLTAQVHKYGTNAGFYRLLEMITYNPAANALIENYGTLPGCDADLVILDAPNFTEAILSQSEKLYVIKRGKVVAKEGKVTGGRE